MKLTLMILAILVLLVPWAARAEKFCTTTCNRSGTSCYTVCT